MTRRMLIGMLAVVSMVAGTGAGAQGVAQQGGPQEGTVKVEKDAGAAAQLIYDWRTGSWTRFRRVSAGEPVTILITGLNRLCFNYTVTDKQVVATENTANFLALINATQPAIDALVKQLYESKPAEPKKADPKPGVAPSSVSSLTWDSKAAMVAEPPGATKAKTLLEAAESYMTSAFTKLGGAGATLKGQLVTLGAARKAADAFYVAACPGMEARAVSNSGALWSVAVPSIEGFVSGVGPAVESAEKDITGSKDDVKLTDAKLLELRRLSDQDDDAARYLTKPEVRARVGGIEKQIEGHGAIVEKQAEPIKLLRQDAGIFRTMLTDIPAQIVSTTQPRTVVLGSDTEALEIDIAAVGKPDLGTVKAVKINDPQRIAVYRRNRAFLSAGFMFSSLEEHDFQRANLIGSDGKAYSTFVDKKSNRNMAFSPTILTHMTLGDYRGVGFAGSAGLGARTVGGRLSPDFVLGGSTMIRDLAVLTLAWHRGRIERLLIGDAATIRKSPVDSSVTREGAVGETWGDAVALIFSVRMR